MTKSKDRTQDDLKSIADKMEECVRKALAAYASDYSELRHKHSKRTEASIIHDHMVLSFEEVFGTQEDAKASGSPTFMHRTGNLRQLVVNHGEYKIRLKKLDAKGLTRNIPTDSVLRFVWQEPQQSFEMIEPPTNLHVGYEVVDDAALTQAKIWVTCPAGNRVGWKWELTKTQDAADAQHATAEIQHFHDAPKQRLTLKAELQQQKDKAKGEGDGSASG